MAWDDGSVNRPGSVLGSDDRCSVVSRCTPLVAAVSGMELVRIGRGGSLVVAEQRGRPSVGGRSTTTGGSGWAWYLWRTPTRGGGSTTSRGRSVPELLVPGRLDFRLIRLRSRASASYREAVPEQVTDGPDRRRTLRRSPENRKVDGSTPSLATTLNSINARQCGTFSCAGLICSTVCPEQLTDLASDAPPEVGGEVSGTALGCTGHGHDLLWRFPLYAHLRGARDCGGRGGQVVL